MVRRFFTVLSLVLPLAAAAVSAHAQTGFSSGDLMRKALNPPAADQWNAFGNGESHKMIRDDSVPGGYALTVTVPAAGDHPWDIQAGISVPRAIKAGDVLLFAFWGRAVTTQQGAGTAHIVGKMQEAHAPYTDIGQQDLTLNSQWKLYYVSGTATRDYAEGESGAGLQLATAAQTVALGPLFVLDFGPGYDLTKLPKN